MSSNGQFKPGQSGNPTGRPKLDVSIRELARKHTESAVQTLADMMNNPKIPPSTRASAATALLDRGWGKPSQHIETSVSPMQELASYLDTLPQPYQAEMDKLLEEFD